MQKGSSGVPETTSSLIFPTLASGTCLDPSYGLVYDVVHHYVAFPIATPQDHNPSECEYVQSTKSDIYLD